MGEDIPIHGVMRFNELAASRAAFEAGLSPQVVYAEQGVLVLAFIEGKTLGESDFQNHHYLEQATTLIRKCHYEIPVFLQGPSLVFWVFQVIRGYCNMLEKANFRLHKQLPKLRQVNDVLCDAVGPVEITFGHNDLLPANFIDDGERLWLIDWDYAGFNSALFDLGGLASNNGLNTDQEQKLIHDFYRRTPDTVLLKSYQAMKCASLLRESTWSMISEIYSDIEFDFKSYTEENLERFNAAFDEFSAKYDQ